IEHLYIPLTRPLFIILFALAAASISTCHYGDFTKPTVEGYWYVDKESIVIDGEAVHEEIQERGDAVSHFQIRVDNSVTYRKFIICNGHTTMNGIYYPDANQIMLEHEGEEYVFEVQHNNEELLLSITYKVTSNDEEIDETTVYHCKKGEAFPE